MHKCPKKVAEKCKVFLGLHCENPQRTKCTKSLGGSRAGFSLYRDQTASAKNANMAAGPTTSMRGCRNDMGDFCEGSGPIRWRAMRTTLLKLEARAP